MLMKKMQTDMSLASHGPMEPLQLQWLLPCLPRKGKKEQRALETAWVPGPVTGTVGCLYICHLSPVGRLYNPGHHDDCQGHAGS